MYVAKIHKFEHKLSSTLYDRSLVGNLACGYEMWDDCVRVRYYPVQLIDISVLIFDRVSNQNRKMLLFVFSVNFHTD